MTDDDFYLDYEGEYADEEIEAAEMLASLCMGLRPELDPSVVLLEMLKIVREPHLDPVAARLIGDRLRKATPRDPGTLQ